MGVDSDVFFGASASLLFLRLDFSFASESGPVFFNCSADSLSSKGAASAVVGGGWLDSVTSFGFGGAVVGACDCDGACG